jgi:hypothetical protein
MTSALGWLTKKDRAKAVASAMAVGLVDDPRGPDDVAEEHDHYLYGAPKRHR